MIPGIIRDFISLIGEMSCSVPTSPHGCIPALTLHLWLIVGLNDVVLILMKEGLGLVSPVAGLTPSHLPSLRLLSEVPIQRVTSGELDLSISFVIVVRLLLESYLLNLGV